MLIDGKTPAAKLKALRQRVGLTIRQLSAEIGYDKSTYYDYESGVRGDEPVPVDLCKRLEVLIGRGVPPIIDKEIIELAGVHFIPERDERLIKAIRSLPAEEQANIEALIYTRAKQD